MIGKSSGSFERSGCRGEKMIDDSMPGLAGVAFDHAAAAYRHELTRRAGGADATHARACSPQLRPPGGCFPLEGPPHELPVAHSNGSAVLLAQASLNDIQVIIRSEMQVLTAKLQTWLEPLLDSTKKLAEQNDASRPGRVYDVRRGGSYTEKSMGSGEQAPSVDVSLLRLRDTPDTPDAGGDSDGLRQLSEKLCAQHDLVCERLDFCCLHIQDMMSGPHELVTTPAKHHYGTENTSKPAGSDNHSLAMTARIKSIHSLSNPGVDEVANSSWLTEDIEDDKDKDDNDMPVKEGDGLKAIFTHDDDLETPLYFVEELYKKDGFCQKVARSSIFGSVTVAVVIVNAVYIGVDADWNTANNPYDADWPFQLCTQFFCTYFTLELLVRFFAFKVASSCWQDGWFRFDLFLVVAMIVDTWMLMPALYALQGNGGGSIRIPTQPLRMLRLFKLTRLAALVRAFPELVTMIKGLLRSVRAISSSLLLLALMVYTWAIILHMMLSKETALNEHLETNYEVHFKTIGDCMWSLVMNGTFMLDNSAPVFKSLIYGGKLNIVLGGISFLLFSLMSATLILQMLIGVLCDVVSQVSHEQRDATAIDFIKQELLGELRKFDDGDGKITKKELMAVMKSPSTIRVFKKLNVNRLFLFELQNMLFPTATSEVSIKGILDLLVMCRGDNPATVQILAAGFLFLANSIATGPTHSHHRPRATGASSP